jgi:ElaA protein
MTTLTWACQPFDALSPAHLYAVLRLRSEVFVMEQQCIFLDADGLDADALHLGAWQQGQLMAYARLLPPGVKAAGPVISRVITAPAARGTGLGHQLNQQALAHIARTWPGQGVTLFAQAHLQPFYARAGFVGVGAEFIEDGIPHREMFTPPPMATP